MENNRKIIDNCAKYTNKSFYFNLFQSEVLQIIKDWSDSLVIRTNKMTTSSLVCTGNNWLFVRKLQQNFNFMQKFKKLNSLKSVHKIKFSNKTLKSSTNCFSKPSRLWKKCSKNEAYSASSVRNSPLSSTFFNYTQKKGHKNTSFIMTKVPRH